MITTLFFDVIGTLVDWRGTIKQKLGNLPVDVSADTIAHEWAMYYAEGDFKYQFDLIQKGYDLVDKYRLDKYMPREEIYNFTHVWTNLKPWPDTVEALKCLRQDYTLVALTNVTPDTLIALQCNTGMPLDFLYSAESVGQKKPARVVYESALQYVGAKASEAVMVAAHRFDLRAAREVGMHTCYVERGDDAVDDGWDFDYCVDSLWGLID